MNAKKKRKPATKRKARSPGLLGSPGEIRMSDILEEFVEPYKTDGITFKELYGLFTTGMIAWNLAMIPEERRQKVFDDVTRPLNLGQVAKTGMWDFISPMIQRKLDHFADIDRFILELSLSGDEDSVNLLVMSSLLPPPGLR